MKTNIIFKTNMKTVNFATMKIFLVPIVQMFVCRTAKDKWMLLKVGNIV